MHGSAASNAAASNLEGACTAHIFEPGLELGCFWQCATCVKLQPSGTHHMHLLRSYTVNSRTASAWISMGWPADLLKMLGKQHRPMFQ
jgi:hypothetical protein